MQPMQPNLPVDPVKPRDPISPMQQARRTGGIIGQTGGIFMVLWYLGVPDEISAAAAGIYGFLISVTARWARDVMHVEEQAKTLKGFRSWLLYVVSAMAPLLLVLMLCTGCASAIKLGPGGYGWFMWQWSVANDFNAGGTVLGQEIQIGQPGKQATITQQTQKTPDGE